MDTLTFGKRWKHLAKVFQHKPLGNSWYDRDFSGELRKIGV